ncbi:MAG: bifunctional folylpolyglutamate synthase/dihydrofolate synthase [Thermomicrobiales bacterium]
MTETANSSTYSDALAAIWARSGYDRGFISNPFAGDDAACLGLMRTSGMLDRLGNPERRYRIVHVAGSKGKGSTTVTVDALLRQTGLRVGRFTSPHLHSYRERIVVQNEMISKSDFATVTMEALVAVEALEREAPELGAVTAWELSTAMALSWYGQAGCDFAVIEVGLGGTLDATNIVDPEISVITRLDYEHTAILGDTLTEIAGNKAGIIKQGKPVVCAAQPDEARIVIESKTRETGSRLILADRDFSVSGSDSDFSYRDQDGTIGHLSTVLAGRHQVDNAALAIATTRALTGVDLSEDQIRAGLRDVVHPGRFEQVRISPVTMLVIDGAHSPVAATALVQAIEERYPGARPLMVVGMLQDKDAGRFVSILHDIAGGWNLAAPASPRALPVSLLGEHLTSVSSAATAFASIPEALAAAIDAKPALIVVTGSLITVAEARVVLGLAIDDPVPATAQYSTSATPINDAPASTTRVS